MMFTFNPSLVWVGVWRSQPRFAPLRNPLNITVPISRLTHRTDSITFNATST